MIAKKALSLAVLFLAVLSPAVAAQALDPRMSALEPLLHKEWKGMMKAPDGSTVWEVVCRFEAVGSGLLVKYDRRTTGRADFEEGYFYWDDPAKKLALFAVHSGGSFRTGLVKAESGVLTIEGRMAWPVAPPDPRVKQSYDFRNTFTLVSETEMTDRWFQNAFGPWRPGHEIVFRGEVKTPARPD
ncbi:MAG: hypothetical protein AB1714_02290 [Acidobacteriota bacterium]